MEPLTFIAGTLLGAGGSWATRRITQAVKMAPKEGLGDLLGWAFLVDEGVILMKDGSLLAGVTFRGQDLESATPEEVEAAAAAAHDAVKLLPPGYALEFNVHRRERREYPPMESGHFPTHALARIDAERRTQFTAAGEHYETHNTALVTYTPPSDTVRRWERMMTQDSGGLNYDAVLRGYNRALAEMIDSMESAFVVQRLGSQELLTECHRCLTGLDDPVAVTQSYISHALASEDLATGYIPRMGRQYIFVLAIVSLGTHTRAAAGDFINSLREEARWHMRFIPLARGEAEKRIRKIETKWYSQRGGIRGLLSPEQNVQLEDPDAVAMQAETAEAVGELKSGRARFGYFCNTLTLRDSDAARGHSRAQTILQVLRDQGLTCSLETINANDAFIGSLPGHGYANLRRPLLSSQNVAHIFPTTTPWAGAATCPNSLFPAGSPPLLYARACGATPFRVNLYQGQVGHTLVVGATGAGKSVLVGFIALSFLRYAESRVYIFDVGRSHQPLTRAAGGVHHDAGGEGASVMQPLRHIDEPGERGWALSWLETIWELNDAPLTPPHKIALANGLSLLAQNPPHQRTLTALYSALPSALQPTLEPYTVRGAYGDLLDGVADGEALARVTTWELSDLLNLGQSIVVPVLLAKFRQVERALDGAPTLIIIEEAWAALMRSTFRERIRQWLLTLRKRNASVVIVVHSVGQIRDMPNASNVTESCPTRIILPNPEARVREHAEVYRFLDLGPREIELVAGARRRRDYYYKSPSGSRLFELNLGPHARSLLMPLPGFTAQASAAHLQQLMAEHGDGYLDYLPSRGYAT